MLALADNAGLRREELCSLRAHDVYPAHRTVRVRAETAKSRLGHIVPLGPGRGPAIADLPLEAIGYPRGNDST
jgi:integrase/recombinase XerD